MKFKFYDILSHLIPGFIVYIIYLQFINEPFSNDFIVPATAIAFVLGYFVNTLASWLEDFYYWTWGGKPSNQLLQGKDIWKVRFDEHKKVKELLKIDSTVPDTNNDALFSIAMRYAIPSVNSRVEDFNANYAFSRVMLTTIIIVTGFMIGRHYGSLIIYLIGIPMIVIAWYRAKQRGYYYAREILNTYLTIKKQEKKSDL